VSDEDLSRAVLNRICMLQIYIFAGQSDRRRNV
jgi:hypothetical protein